MKKHIIFLTLTALLAAFVAACNDNGTDDGGKDDAGEELKQVVTPSNLRIESQLDVSAVLAWDGENSEYEVEWNGEVLPATQSISYGIENLTPETTYTWKVRAKEGERYSEWVEGPAVTTLELIDYTQGWIGEWQASDFVMQTMVNGTVELPVNAFFEELPQNVSFSITQLPEASDEIEIRSSTLTEMWQVFPAMRATVRNGSVLVTDEVADVLETKLELPIPYTELPEEWRSAVEELIGSLADPEALDTLAITEMSVETQDLDFRASMKESELSAQFSIDGKLSLTVNNDLVNALLAVVPPSVTFKATMTLKPNAEAVVFKQPSIPLLE